MSANRSRERPAVRLLHFLAVGGIVAVGSLGCGGGAAERESLLDDQPAEALERVVGASADVREYRVRTQFVRDGEALASNTQYRHGEGFTGEFSMGERQVSFTVIGDVAYWRGNLAFYKGFFSPSDLPQVALTVGTRYMRTSVADSPLGGFTSTETIFADLKTDTARYLKPAALTLERGPVVVGVPTVRFRDGDGTDDSSLLVADDGSLRILELKAKVDGVNLTVTDLRSHVDLRPPPAEDVFVPPSTKDAA